MKNISNFVSYLIPTNLKALREKLSWNAAISYRNVFFVGKNSFQKLLGLETMASNENLSKSPMWPFVQHK